jgi:choline kinase
MNQKTSANPKRTGIILAAGMGMRLRIHSKDNSDAKPLVPVGDLELLLRTIQSHEKAARERVIIVTGWQAEYVENEILARYAGPVELCFAYNKNYRLKNGISVLCARAFVKSDFILTMADHVLDDRIMELAKDRNPPADGATLCVDYKIDTIFDIDDATKVVEEHGRIRRIGKEIDGYNCIDTGVFIGTDGLFQAIDRIYRQNGDASLSEGVQLLADSGKMEALDIVDAYWQDVDTPEMLAHAEELLRNQIKN